jgi:thiol:disulfide interchange protein
MASINIVLGFGLLLFFAYLVNLFLKKSLMTKNDVQLAMIIAIILWLFVLVFSGFSFLDYLFVKSARSSSNDLIGGVTMITFFVEIFLCLVSLLGVATNYRNGDYREVVIFAAMPYIGCVFFICMLLLSLLLKSLF